MVAYGVQITVLSSFYNYCHGGKPEELRRKNLIYDCISYMIFLNMEINRDVT